MVDAISIFVITLDGKFSAPSGYETWMHNHRILWAAITYPCHMWGSILLIWKIKMSNYAIWDRFQPHADDYDEHIINEPLISLKYCDCLVRFHETFWIILTD